MRKGRWAVVIVGGAAAVLLRRRAGAGARERADLTFDDGSTVSLSGSPDAERLLALARDVLDAAGA